MKLLYVLSLTFIFLGCSSEKTILTLASSLDSEVLVSNLNVNNISVKSFDISVEYTGDSNSAVKLYYCNNTDSPGCIPTNTIGTLTKTESIYHIQVEASDLAASDDPGDELTIRVESSNSSEPAQDKSLILSTSAVNHNYRSVGPGNTSAIATGTSNKLTITGNKATFEKSLANNIGVGDVIQYDSNGDSSVDTLAFIYFRLSSTSYLVKNVSGTDPIAVNDDTNWSLFRAYTSIQDAEEADENIGIDPSLRDFESWSNGNDIVSSNSAWHIALYADAIDTNTASLNLWVTSEVNSLRIFAPKSKSEVGVSQRHNGVWDNTKAMLSVTDNRAFYVLDEHITIEGLQIETIITGTMSSRPAVQTNISEAFTFTNNIVKGNHTSTGNYNHGIRAHSSAAGAICKINNNLFFGLDTSPNAWGVYASGPGTNYIYNNTVNGAKYGYYTTNTSYLFNNIAQNSLTNGFRGSIHASSDYNLSDHADTTGLNSVNSSSLAFIDIANGNFNLAETDTDAIDSGADLSLDLILPFNNDLAGNNRVGLWDMGALNY